MKKIVGEKPLKYYTVKDVKKVIWLALNTKSKADLYIQMEDVYTNNAALYFSREHRHSGGGRFTVATVVTYGESKVIETDDNGNVIRWNEEAFCNHLYKYIKEHY